MTRSPSRNPGLPTLRLVESDDDADLRHLIAARRHLMERVKHIDLQLLAHGRRIADQRGEFLRLSIQQLDREFGQ